MLLPVINPAEYFSDSTGKWSSSREGIEVQRATIGICAVSLVATAILRTPLFIMPAFIMAGFYLGCLVKKELVHYTVAVSFFCKAYTLEGQYKSLRWTVLAIVFVSSVVFPILAAVIGTAFGVYCGLLY